MLPVPYRAIEKEARPSSRAGFHNVAQLAQPLTGRRRLHEVTNKITSDDILLPNQM